MPKILKFIAIGVAYFVCFYALTAATLYLSQINVQAYPVPGKVYKIAGMVFAITCTAVCFMARKKWKWGIFFSVISIFIATHQITAFYLPKGFAYAKLYATEIAHAVKRFHETRGRWPERERGKYLANGQREKPSDTLPAFDIPAVDLTYEWAPNRFTNEMCQEIIDNGYCIITGFRIAYGYPVDSGSFYVPKGFQDRGFPLFTVSSRGGEIEAVYNWETKQWEDQPRRSSKD